MKFLVASAVAYFATLLILAIGQRAFLYPAPKGEGRMPAGFEKVAYPTSDGLVLSAGYKAAAAGKPTIVYFHGNGADWQSSVVATDRLTPSGFGVLAAEYRGYRGNPGNPSEEGLYRDARAAVRFLAAKGVAENELVLVGNSIGSGPAVQLAIETSPRALVLISAFASLPQIASEKLWWLPVGPLVRDKFNNKAKIAQVDAPILLLHGDSDTLIPDHHSHILAERNPLARLHIVKGAGHDLAWRDEAETKILMWLGGLGPN